MGLYQGIILTTTAKDGNQGLFPVAFAVVDFENFDNWLWFLVELKKVVGNDHNIVFLSDRNVSLLEALPQVFPDKGLYYCLEHLKNNLRDKFRSSTYSDTFREHFIWLFSECAHASSESLF